MSSACYSIDGNTPTGHLLWTGSVSPASGSRIGPVSFPPGYRPTSRSAPLVEAVAEARWVVTNAEATLHTVHARIVDGLAGGLGYRVLEQAADAALEAREDLSGGAEIIEGVALDTYDPERGHVGLASGRDRADLERGRERAWTAHLAGGAIIDQLDTAAAEQHRQSFRDLG